jgi:ribonuclease-3
MANPSTIRERKSELDKLLGYTFDEEDLLIQALTRPAYANEEGQKGHPCSDQLSFTTLGDAILKAALVNLLRKRGCTTPAMITKIKSQFEENASLAQFGRDKGIWEFIITNAGEGSRGPTQDNVIADTIEAIVGAIFVETGYEKVEKVIEGWFWPKQ